MIAPLARPDYYPSPMSPAPSPTPQPPRQRWGRILAWGGAGVAGLGLFAALVLSFWLNAYLRSDAFCAMVSQKTSALFQANGQYLPFHWTGFSVYSDGYQARGESGAIFRDLHADQIRAEFEPQGVFHHAWQINELTIQRLQVTLGGAATTAARTEPRPPVAEGNHSSMEGKPPGEPRRSLWIPDRLELRRTQIQEANLAWSTTSATGSVRQVRVTIEPEDRAWLATGSGGQLRQTGWPVLTLDHIRLRYQSPELFITDGQLKLGESENVNVTGQLTFAPQPALDLQVKINGVGITPFLPVDWRARLKGLATGDARLRGRPDDAESISATGTLSLAAAKLEALPVLDRIALFTRTEQFRQVVLQKASADFVWTKSKLAIHRLLLESTGLIRVEGACVVAQGNLAGRFQVGVTPTSLRWLPGSQARVFTVERDGYVWTPVRVTGPLDDLQEDLSQRLIAAAGTELYEGVKGTVEKGAKDLLDLLKPLTP